MARFTCRSRQSPKSVDVLRREAMQCVRGSITFHDACKLNLVLCMPTKNVSNYARLRYPLLPHSARSVVTTSWTGVLS